MMEITRVTDGDYARYEELLLQRDQLAKEAEEYQDEYTRTFGDLITEVFQKKIECIGLKKAITYIQMKKSSGETVDPESLQDYLDTHMTAYYEQLNELIARRSFAEGGRPISAFDVAEIKKIYRRLAKLLHPDISPLTADSPRLADLFQQVMTAYRCNDLQRLQELELLVNRELGELGQDSAAVVIANVEEKITRLEEEIGEILTTEPYTYKNLLADAFAVEEKKKALEEELASYTKYARELQKLLESLADQEEP